VCTECIETFKTFGNFEILTILIKKGIECPNTFDTFVCIKTNKSIKMKIAVYSAKGGVGKTPISTNIALDRGYAIGTNERFHCFDAMEIIDEDVFMPVAMEDEFPDFGDDLDIVFDLAGSISKNSHSISSAIQQADLVIVPIENEFKSITSGVNTLLEVKELGKPILVVATKLEKGKKEIFTDWKNSQDFKNIQEFVHKNAGKEIPVLPLKRSKIFDAIFDREQSISQIVATDPLARHQQSNVNEQFNQIYSFIDSITHEPNSTKKKEQPLSV